MTPQEIEALPYRPCVGVMLARADGHVFVGLRNDGPKDAWQMPQGGIDPGEEPETAALRELWEETGVTRDLVSVEARTEDWLAYDLPPDIAGRIWGGRFRGQKQLWFLLRFHGTDDQVRIDMEHPEFGDWKWLPPDELVDAVVPFKRDVYARVMEQLGPHL
ncbi:MAG: RNA pyrophosphohydrolase [Pseudomonadota bacterium]